MKECSFWLILCLLSYHRALTMAYCNNNKHPIRLLLSWNKVTHVLKYQTCLCLKAKLNLFPRGHITLQKGKVKCYHPICWILQRKVVRVCIYLFPHSLSHFLSNSLGLSPFYVPFLATFRRIVSSRMWFLFLQKFVSQLSCTFYQLTFESYDERCVKVLIPMSPHS